MQKLKLAILILLSVFFAYLRVDGFKSQAFQGAVHIFVGYLIGYAVAGSGKKLRRLHAVLAVLLTILEIFFGVVLKLV